MTELWSQASGPVFLAHPVVLGKYFIGLSINIPTAKDSVKESRLLALSSPPVMCPCSLGLHKNLAGIKIT